VRSTRTDVKFIRDRPAGRSLISLVLADGEVKHEVVSVATGRAAHVALIRAGHGVTPHVQAVHDIVREHYLAVLALPLLAVRPIRRVRLRMHADDHGNGGIRRSIAVLGRTPPAGRGGGVGGGADDVVYRAVRERARQFRFVFHGRRKAFGRRGGHVIGRLQKNVVAFLATARVDAAVEQAAVDEAGQRRRGGGLVELGPRHAAGRRRFERAGGRLKNGRHRALEVWCT